MELKLLKVLENKSNYDRFSRFVKSKTISSETFLIFRDIPSYFKEMSKSSIDWNEFDTWFCMVKHSSYAEEKLNNFKHIFNRLASMSFEDDSTSKVIVSSLIEREYASQIYEEAIALSEGTNDEASLGKVEKLLDEYYESVGRVKDIDKYFVTDDLNEIMDHVKGGTGLEWRLEELNVSCGPIRKGDFLIISSRPDSGKTTMLAAEGTYMAGQLEEDAKVIWFNNEEEGRKVKSRIYQAALGKELTWLDNNREEAVESYTKLMNGMKDRILVVDNKRMNVKDCEEVLKNVNAGLIIFDQLWKVFGFEHEATTDVDRLTKMYAWAREMAATYAPVITVHQADATAHGQEFIEMNQMYMSKCLARNTKVRMFDGSIKFVQDIVDGDVAMGMDSKPRYVSKTSTGIENMYKITHKNGLSYTVNESHILTLKKTTTQGYPNIPKGTVVDIPLRKLLDNPTILRHFKGFTQSIEYYAQVLPIDPYIFGLWITDGKKSGAEWATKDIEFRNSIEQYALRNGYEYKEWSDGSCWYPRLKFMQGVPHPFINILKNLGVYNNKHIPAIYRIGSIRQRLELLAGIIDGDGCLVTRKHQYYEVYSENLDIAEAIQEVALSCGFNSTVKPKKNIYRVVISGDICTIPVKIARKISNYSSKKDVTTSTLEIELVGRDKYYGFTVDCDSRYMLANYIPTHNTGLQGEADAIITLGRNLEDSTKQYSRGLYVPKNKLAGGSRTIPEMRNGKFEIQIAPHIARFKGNY